MEAEFMEMSEKRVDFLLSAYHYRNENGKHVVECPALRTAGIEDNHDEALRMCLEMSKALVQECLEEDGGLERMLLSEGWTILWRKGGVTRFRPPTVKPAFHSANHEVIALSA